MYLDGIYIMDVFIILINYKVQNLLSQEWISIDHKEGVNRKQMYTCTLFIKTDVLNYTKVKCPSSDR